jgi:hypothetical protein
MNAMKSSQAISRVGTQLQSKASETVCVSIIRVDDEGERESPKYWIVTPHVGLHG